MKIAESSDRQKTLWEKEKLLIMSNFTFSPQCFPKTSIAGRTSNDKSLNLNTQIVGQCLDIQDDH